jgi:uncharacterized membrane protein YdbT with pleckstrin-like domain
VPFPQRLLSDDEEVIVDLHPHWWYLAAPVTAVLISIAAAITTLVRTDADTTVRTAGSWGSLGLLALSSAWLIVRYSRWMSTFFVITSRRVIFRTGMLRTRGSEIPLDRVNTVHFSQGLLERMVGAGDLTIESGSDAGRQRFTDIRNPDRVQKVLHEEIDARRSR